MGNSCLWLERNLTFREILRIFILKGCIKCLSCENNMAYKVDYLNNVVLLEGVSMKKWGTVCISLCFINKSLYLRAKADIPA